LTDNPPARLRASSLGRDPVQATAIIKEKLHTNLGYELHSDEIGNPTIRILKPGTFKEYRHWKAKTNGISSSQIIKVPTMLTDPVTIDWLVERVVLEV
jgi:hypothetical protein